MKLRKFSPLALFFLVLATCACLAGIHMHRERYIFIRDVRYEVTTTELDLSGEPARNLEELKQLPGLTRLDLRGTGLTISQYDTLRQWFPDCEILWEIPFQGVFYPEDTRELTITAISDGDMALLDRFPQLQRIQAQACADYAQLTRLRRLRPDLEVNYRISLGGESYAYDITRLIISGEDPEGLAGMIPWFTELKDVTLIAPLAQMDRILALREAFPQIRFTWSFSIGGVAANEFTEALDLTGIAMTVEETEALLTYLPHLTWLDMTDCGISNEEMEALNNRYENIKIVWTVTLGRWYRLRTDATWFMPVKHDFYPRGNDLENLKYCHDIIALDIGHMKISSCEFVRYMPKLKYLLMADTQISDLTPLTGLKELIYLELFLTKVTDCSPLLTITTLEDLNLCYTHVDPNIIAQMTWLKNLWWSGAEYAIHIVRPALTETHLEFHSPSSTGYGWRELPNYYAQRDIFGMRYMKD